MFNAFIQTPEGQQPQEGTPMLMRNGSLEHLIEFILAYSDGYGVMMIDGARFGRCRFGDRLEARWNRF